MKTLLGLTVAAMLCVCAIAPATAQKESQAAKITALENKWNAAYKGRDAEHDEFAAGRRLPDYDRGRQHVQ